MMEITEWFAVWLYCVGMVPTYVTVIVHEQEKGQRLHWLILCAILSLWPVIMTIIALVRAARK